MRGTPPGPRDRVCLVPAARTTESPATSDQLVPLAYVGGIEGALVAAHRSCNGTLPPRPNGRSRSGQRVELHLRLDDRIVVWDGERELMATAAPVDPVQLRALGYARVEVGTPVRSATTSTSPTNQPWRATGPQAPLRAPSQTR